VAESRDVIVEREPLELYKLLKFENLAASGGEAKYFIDQGLVQVNGEIETRKRRKLYSGDSISLAEVSLRLVSA
jgi:ribosome-associated protein